MNLNKDNNDAKHTYLITNPCSHEISFSKVNISRDVLRLTRGSLCPDIINVNSLA